jgi:hypothetical protein
VEALECPLLTQSGHELLKIAAVQLDPETRPSNSVKFALGDAPTEYS